jgi:hypothetical protein
VIIADNINRPGLKNPVFFIIVSAIISGICEISGKEKESLPQITQIDADLHFCSALIHLINN